MYIRALSTTKSRIMPKNSENKMTVVFEQAAATSVGIRAFRLYANDSTSAPASFLIQAMNGEQASKQASRQSKRAPGTGCPIKSETVQYRERGPLGQAPFPLQAEFYFRPKTSLVFRLYRGCLMPQAQKFYRSGDIHLYARLTPVARLSHMVNMRGLNNAEYL